MWTGGVWMGLGWGLGRWLLYILRMVLGFCLHTDGYERRVFSNGKNSLMPRLLFVGRMQPFFFRGFSREDLVFCSPPIALYYLTAKKVPIFKYSCFAISVSFGSLFPRRI